MDSICFNISILYAVGLTSSVTSVLISIMEASHSFTVFLSAKHTMHNAGLDLDLDIGIHIIILIHLP